MQVWTNLIRSAYSARGRAAAAHPTVSPRMTATNHADPPRRPPDRACPTPSDWERTTEPVPEPGEGEFVVAISHLSIDPAMRGWMNDGPSYIEPVELGAVMRAGGRRRGDRLAASRLRGRRPRLRRVRDPGVRALRRRRGDQGRPGAGAVADLPRRARPHRPDGVLRPARRRPTARRRDRRRLRRRGRGRERRRPDRQDQGLPRDRDRRRRREVRLARRRARLRRRDRLQVRGRPRARCASTRRTGIDVFFDNVGGEILDAALAPARPRRPDRDLRRDLAVQRRADAGPRRTTWR